MLVSLKKKCSALGKLELKSKLWLLFYSISSEISPVFYLTQKPNHAVKVDVIEFNGSDITGFHRTPWFVNES